MPGSKLKKSTKQLICSASALALGMSVGSAFAADAFEERIEEAHMERVTSLSMGIYGAHTNIDDSEDVGGMLDTYTSIGGDFNSTYRSMMAGACSLMHKANIIWVVPQLQRITTKDFWVVFT